MTPPAASIMPPTLERAGGAIRVFFVSRSGQRRCGALAVTMRLTSSPFSSSCSQQCAAMPTSAARCSSTMHATRSAALSRMFSTFLRDVLVGEHLGDQVAGPGISAASRLIRLSTGADWPTSCARHGGGGRQVARRYRSMASPNSWFSAARPASAMRDQARSPRTASTGGALRRRRGDTRPSAPAGAGSTPRGCRGRTSAATSAWPASWIAMRRRSSGW